MHLRQPRFEISDCPSDEFIQLIGSPLRAFNESRIGPYCPSSYAVLAYDSDTLIGGISGWIQFDWLFIDLAWVEESYRGQGVGKSLLIEFETLGKQRGVTKARLNTASFQTGLEFYQTNGYRVFAEIEITTPNGEKHTDYFLRKDNL